ncbi:hypothetical protein [Exiguobacterium aestuarii]|uniref:hypothetical protein n=1 Tax=Exiguobacterium aestuarii TaxID=273527 RepID=UPI001CD39124|nr:hypothetical protein [Exiguobacterium aestuarii]MCA0980222.1 hypothetical protein [Exiguobacterium aestuarii]
MEKYFISYNYANRTGSGFGCTQTLIDRKITDIDVVREIAKSIEKDYGFDSGSVIILSFQRFDQ